MSDATISSRTLAGLLGHLARAGEAEGPRDGLTGAQWSALRYLARANHLSRTVSALAAYQGTTRGTVSQTVKALVRAGYVERRPSGRDGRSVRLDPTEAGWSKLRADSGDRLAAALERMPDTQRRELTRSVLRLTGELAAEADGSFGTCETCRYFAAGGGDRPHVCHLAGCALAPADLDALCVAYVPARREASAGGRT